MGRSVETLHKPSNFPFTVSEIDTQIQSIDRQTQFLHDLLKPNGDQPISANWREHPGLSREGRKLRSKKEVFQVVYKSGLEIQARLDEEVRFTQMPAVLLDDPDALAKFAAYDLRVKPIPAFPVEDPQEVENFLRGEGNAHSKALGRYPEEYWRGILKGKIAFPHPHGYYIALDVEGASTKLSRALGIDNLPMTSLARLNAQAAKQERKVVESMGFDPDKYEMYIRGATQKEAGMLGLERSGEPKVTNTHIRNTEDHLVFNGTQMDTIKRSESGIPTRLVVVLSNRPKRIDYLKT